MDKVVVFCMTCVIGFVVLFLALWAGVVFGRLSWHQSPPSSFYVAEVILLVWATVWALLSAWFLHLSFGRLFFVAACVQIFGLYCLWRFSTWLTLDEWLGYSVAGGALAAAILYDPQRRHSN